MRLFHYRSLAMDDLEGIKELLYEYCYYKVQKYRSLFDESDVKDKAAL